MTSMQSEIENKILTCPLCLNILTDPKCLPCIHTFCAECLRMHVQHTANRGLFHCPECRESVWLKPEGVDAFRTNFFINRLKDLKFNERSTEGDLPCRFHPSKTITLFCDQCNTCVCAECIVQKHKGHPCLMFSDARKDRENTLKNRLNDLEIATNAANESVAIQTRKANDIKQRQADASDNVKTATKALIEGIQALAKQTIRGLGDVTVPVLEEHAVYIDELETHTTQLESDMAKMRLAVQKSSDVEMLDAYKDTVERVSNICMKNYGNKEESLQKSTSDLKSTYNDLYAKFASQCKELIHEAKRELTQGMQPQKPEPRKNRFRRSLRSKAKLSGRDVGKMSSKLGKKLKELGRPTSDRLLITGLCVHANSGYIYGCIGDKAYKYGGFMKKWRDIHPKLIIGNGAVCDVHDFGEFVIFSVRSENLSPCKLVRYNHDHSTAEVLELGFSSDLPGLYVCENKTILVTDFNRGLVHRVSWDGATLESFGGNVLKKPWYISQTSSGKVIVCDNVGKSDVFLFNADGTFAKSLKDESVARDADYTLCDPYGVRVDKYDRIYVTCCWSNCVLVFSESGEYLNVMVNPDHGITHPATLYFVDEKVYIGHKDGIVQHLMTL